MICLPDADSDSRFMLVVIDKYVEEDFKNLIVKFKANLVRKYC